MTTTLHAASGALLLACACSLSPQIRSSALRTGTELPPSSAPVTIVATRDPPAGEQLGVVEASAVPGTRSLDRLLAAFRARVAELGGDLGRVDAFPTTFRQVRETVERACGERETRVESRTIVERAPDGTSSSTTSTTTSAPETTGAPGTCTEERWVEHATQNLVGRAFRLPAAAAAAPRPRAVSGEHALLRPPGGTGASAVRLSMDGEPPPATYDEVALVTATTAASGESLLLLLARLQLEAAALGCDAVLRVRHDAGTDHATASGVAVRIR